MGNLERDIALTIEQYPKLLLKNTPDRLPSLEGNVDIVSNNVVIESFEVRIQYTSKYPYAFPRVYEIGGRFPRKDERMHINPDGTLCLDVEQGEMLVTKYGMETPDFIRDILIPNLAWRVCKQEGLTNGLAEYRHGTGGIIDWYKAKLRVENEVVVYELIEKFLLGRINDRQENCPCGSGRRFKRCHRAEVTSLKSVDRDTLSQHFEAIKLFVGI